MLDYILAACGGNVSTTTGSSATPGATKVVPAGLKIPTELQWGSDYVSGAPYVFQDPANPKSLVGFEVEIAQAIAGLMGITQTQVEIEYGNLDQALYANQFDMVMNGWEKTVDREKTELFSTLIIAMVSRLSCAKMIRVLRMSSIPPILKFWKATRLVLAAGSWPRRLCRAIRRSTLKLMMALCF